MLLVGAGPVGESKIEASCRPGAAVSVVAPEATPAIAEGVPEGPISWDGDLVYPPDLMASSSSSLPCPPIGGDIR